MTTKAKKSRDRPLSVLHPLSPPLVFFEICGLFMLDVGLTEKWLGEEWALGWVLTFLTGILGLTYTAWCWRGQSIKARSWAHMQWGANLAIIGIPFFSLASLSIGLGKVLELPGPVALAPFILSLWCIVLIIAGKGDCPRWWGPKWFRTGKYKGTDKRPWDPLGTLMGKDAEHDEAKQRRNNPE